jgi:hypothetical protein
VLTTAFHAMPTTAGAASSIQWNGRDVSCTAACVLSVVSPQRSQSIVRQMCTGGSSCAASVLLLHRRQGGADDEQEWRALVVLALAHLVVAEGDLVEGEGVDGEEEQQCEAEPEHARALQEVCPRQRRV